MDFFFLQAIVIMAGAMAFVGARADNKMAKVFSLLSCFVVQLALLVHHIVTIVTQGQHPNQAVVRSPFIAITAFGMLETAFLLADAFGLVNLDFGSESEGDNDEEKAKLEMGR